MPSNQVWDELILKGGGNPEWSQPFQSHPAEMLFDLEKDPDELHDLSGVSEYEGVLCKMRQALSAHIRVTTDLGFFYLIHV